MDDGPPVFSADSSCPQILWIPPALLRFHLSDSHTLRSAFPCASTDSGILCAVRTPAALLLPVWPLPLSLATTRGISFDFSSSRYLDVSVPGVPLIYLCIQYTIHGSSPCVLPHSEIRGYNAHLQLPAAYRSLSRPSSAPDAKAFTLCSFSLELLWFSRGITVTLLRPCVPSELLEFQNIWIFILLASKRSFDPYVPAPVSFRLPEIISSGSYSYFCFVLPLGKTVVFVTLNFRKDL